MPDMSFEERVSRYKVLYDSYDRRDIRCTEAMKRNFVIWKTLTDEMRRQQEAMARFALGEIFGRGTA